MKKYALYFFLIILIVSSCRKVTESTSSTDLDVPDFVQKARMLAVAAVADSSVFDNYVAIVCTQTANIINRDSSYQTSAYARVSENGVPVNAGPLTLNNKTILPGTDNLYAYNYSIAEGKALLGTTIQALISDSAVNTNVTRTTARLRSVGMIVPKEILPASIQFPKGIVDRNSNDTIKWSPDPTNQFGKVQITVSYYKGISQFNSANMPSTITNLSYTVTDNGIFVIPKTDLIRFPKGAYIGISISRAWLDNTSGKIAYISILEAHTVPLLVIDTSPAIIITDAQAYLSHSGPSTLTMQAFVTGGAQPLNYSWTVTKLLSNGSYGVPITLSTSNSILSFSWPANTYGKVDLKVTDASGNTTFRNNIPITAYSKL